MYKNRKLNLSQFANVSFFSISNTDKQELGETNKIQRKKKPIQNNQFNHIACMCVCTQPEPNTCKQ